VNKSVFFSSPWKRLLFSRLWGGGGEGEARRAAGARGEEAQLSGDINPKLILSQTAHN
jgi:hypothetical protein